MVETELLLVDAVNNRAHGFILSFLLDLCF